MTARRLGLFGGTFNPVHEGHLQIARDAKRAAELDEVMFIPCATPPHKTPTWLASGEDRLNMLTLALENEPAFTVNDLELDREGPSYSIDTVRAIRAQHPDDALTFIIGSDSLVELHLWKDIEELLSLATFLTIARPGQEAVRPDQIPLPPPWPETLSAAMITGTLMDISSSDVRERVAKNASIVSLVPDPVRSYIDSHGLYHA